MVQVDASIIPMNISAHLQATLYAIAEKVCQILSRCRKQLDIVLQAADIIKTEN
jgi:choline dehydrogenase-like flavoprotein